MAFNGSGLFVRLYNWVTDHTNGVNITDSRMDAEMDGFASGLSTCVTRDGQGKMSAAFLPNADNTLDLGSSGARWRNAFLGGTLSVADVGSAQPAIQTPGAFSSIYGTKASVSGTPVTLTGLQIASLYLVTATLAASNDPVNYSAVAVVSTGVSVAKITTIQTAALMGLSLSGMNLQATQGSGAGATITYSAIRLM